MDVHIPVKTLDGAVDLLTFVRVRETVQVVYRGSLIADVPARDLDTHLAGAAISRWRKRQLGWGDLTVALARPKKVVLTVRHKIGTNTLLPDELQSLTALVSTDADSLTPETGAARHGGAQPL